MDRKYRDYYKIVFSPVISSTLSIATYTIKIFMMVLIKQPILFLLEFTGFSSNLP